MFKFLRAEITDESFRISVENPSGVFRSFTFFMGSNDRLLAVECGTHRTEDEYSGGLTEMEDCPITGDKCYYEGYNVSEHVILRRLFNLYIEEKPHLVYDPHR